MTLRLRKALLTLRYAKADREPNPTRVYAFGPVKWTKGKVDTDKHVKVSQTNVAQCERIYGSSRQHMGIINYGYLHCLSH